MISVSIKKQEFENQNTCDIEKDVNENFTNKTKETIQRPKKIVFTVVITLMMIVENLRHCMRCRVAGESDLLTRDGNIIAGRRRIKPGDEVLLQCWYCICIKTDDVHNVPKVWELYL